MLTCVETQTMFFSTYSMLYFWDVWKLQNMTFLNYLGAVDGRWKRQITGWTQWSTRGNCLGEQDGGNILEATCWRRKLAGSKIYKEDYTFKIKSNRDQGFEQRYTSKSINLAFFSFQLCSSSLLQQIYKHDNCTHYACSSLQVARSQPSSLHTIRLLHFKRWQYHNHHNCTNFACSSLQVARSQPS